MFQVELLEGRKFSLLLFLNLIKATLNLWFAGLIALSILIFIKLRIS